LGQLLDIEIAAVLARRQGAQAGEPARTLRHGALQVGRKGEAALVDDALLAHRPLHQLFGRRRDTRHAHEWRARDAHPGDLRRAGPAVADLPMHQERLGHHVAQKAETRHDRAERGRLRDDVGELDLQQIAGHGPLDEDRAGQRVDRARVEAGEIGDRRPRRNLAVERVAGFERDLLALADLGHRCDIGMVAVVADMRLGAEPLVAIDPDRLHALLPVNRTSEPFVRLRRPSSRGRLR
jgi:hypothetical protein